MRFSMLKRATPKTTLNDQKAAVQRLLEFQSFTEAAAYVMAEFPFTPLPARQVHLLLDKMPDRVNSLRVFNLVCINACRGENYPAYLTEMLAAKMERVLVEVSLVDDPTCRNYLRGPLCERFFSQLATAHRSGAMPPLMMNAMHELVSRVDCASDDVRKHLYAMGLCTAQAEACESC